jgi:hypothetical protein
VSHRSILFLAWGDRFIADVVRSIRESQLPDYPITLITDKSSDTGQVPVEISVLRRDLKLSGKAIKCQLLAELPDGFETVLFLDADTRVIGPIALGFEKAELHGIAMTPAPHYSLEEFRQFRRVMMREEVTPQGQIIYNSGVMFLAAHKPEVRAVLHLAYALARKDPAAHWSDQPYISLAMEMSRFNPYTLSPSFNYRAFGELISGSVRIWHSYSPVPEEAANLQPGYLHRYENGALIRVMKVPN